MPTVVISNFNLVCSLVGGFALGFGLLSYFVKEKLYVSEAMPSLIFGATFKAAGLFRPDQYGASTLAITREFTRLVLGCQLVLAGVELPAKYLWREWKSLFMLLLPVMTFMWLVSALIVYLCMPGLRWIDSLIVAACFTPTDPVLSASIVKGRYAEKHVSESLRDLISAESGANDGFGYPFLFLALYILRDRGTTIAKDWIVETVIYQILLSVAYGAVVGYIALCALRYGRSRNLVGNESFLFFAFTLALFTVGTAGLFGTDDLLACFVAGNVFTCDWFRVETEHNSVVGSLDMALNVAMFMWIGAVTPWAEFSTSEIPVWRFIVMGIAVLLFRRLPVVLLLYKAIPRIANVREALFAGFFGPIGVGAVFYLQVCLEELESIPPTRQVEHLMEVVGPVVYFVVLSSVVVHGLAIPLAMLGPRFPRKIRMLAAQFRAVVSNRTRSAPVLPDTASAIDHRSARIETYGSDIELADTELALDSKKVADRI